MSWKLAPTSVTRGFCSALKMMVVGVRVILHF
jgi:hypothetical protein